MNPQKSSDIKLDKGLHVGDKIITSENTNLSHKNLFKVLLKENLTNEGIQSFIKIFVSSQNTIKLFWIFCLIAANGLCSFLVIQTILAYLAFGVTTVTRTLIETPSLFPKITFCNNNQFTTDYGINFLKGINKMLMPNLDIFDADLMKNVSYTDKQEVIATIYNAAVSKMLGESFNDTERKKLGHSLEDILFSCLYNNQKCTSEDFIWKFDRYYGNCFVFNSGMNSSGHIIEFKKSLIAGSSFGLHLDFYVGFNQNLSLFNSLYGKGGYIRIENSSMLNDDTLDGILLTPGTCHIISIHRRFEYSLPKPYSNCDIYGDSYRNFDSEIYNLIRKSSHTYKQQLCFNLCIQKRLIQNCSCSDPLTLSLFNSTSCMDIKQQECMNIAYQELLFKNSFILENCAPHCPLECNKTEFDISTSSIELMGDLFVDFINKKENLLSDFQKKPIDSETTKKNFVSVYLFYNTHSYTHSTESQIMDIVSLLANIGGTLGLFLGISLLQVCEIIEVLVHMILIKKKKNEIHTVI